MKQDLLNNIVKEVVNENIDFIFKSENGLRESEKRIQQTREIMGDAVKNLTTKVVIANILLKSTKYSTLWK